MRQLLFPVSMISQWWVTRSNRALVIFWSPKTWGHSPKLRLVVMMTGVLSALGAKGRGYYFAYGGCTGSVPAGITVVGRNEIEVEAKRNKKVGEYLSFFRQA